ncbi:MAG: hypothetical protein H0W78_15300 [Planctomycetes bacterium]|jgi:hypothetical protein|nr:hypothetical protein [Planctomycetota bacterium]
MLAVRNIDVSDSGPVFPTYLARSSLIVYRYFQAIVSRALLSVFWGTTAIRGNRTMNVVLPLFVFFTVWISVAAASLGLIPRHRGFHSTMLEHFHAVNAAG